MFLRSQLSVSKIVIPQQFKSSPIIQSESASRSVVSDSLRSHELQPAMLLCPQDFSDKNTGVGCHFLLQGSSRPRDGTRVYYWLPLNLSILLSLTLFQSAYLLLPQLPTASHTLFSSHLFSLPHGLSQYFSSFTAHYCPSSFYLVIFLILLLELNCLT